MNRPILRLYGFVAVLFALLVAFTSRWTVFEASSLRDNKLNARTLLEQQRIDRGPIVAADGSVLARSLPRSDGTYERIYPAGEEFAHAVGYHYLTLGNSGTELFRNPQLTGQTGTNVQSILDQLQGENRSARRSSRRSTRPPSASPTRPSPGTRGRSWRWNRAAEPSR